MRDATLGVARSRENGSWESAVKRFVWEDARSTRSHDFVTVLLFLSVKCFGSSRQAGESAKMLPDEDFSSAARIANP
ncbi:uncharacterized protein G6M90_00g044780 [Metarhizium brunneum]|uniref:Uncharacterized protein n=1 Tax=Metarhizium brunneum TaxID=500148 RepID=A0A7D5UWC7_9HYPO|nr:hypothetical protein G6M90_00g044780 [Metarhizium brunneum]